MNLPSPTSKRAPPVLIALNTISTVNSIAAAANNLAAAAYSFFSPHHRSDEDFKQSPTPVDPNCTPNSQTHPVVESKYFTFHSSVTMQQSNLEPSVKSKKKTYNTDPNDIHSQNLKKELDKINESPLKRGEILKHRIIEIQSKFIKRKLSVAQKANLTRRMQELHINNVNFQTFIEEIFYFADHRHFFRTWGSNIKNTASINKILAELHYYNSNPEATKKFIEAVKRVDEIAIQSALKKCEINYKKCADINAQDEDGKNVLHWTAEKNNEKIFSILLPRMSLEAILAEDKQGKTPLDYAIKNNSVKIIEMLHRKILKVVSAQDEKNQIHIVDLQLFFLNTNDPMNSSFSQEKSLETSTKIFFEEMPLLTFLKDLLKEEKIETINSKEVNRRTILHHLFYRNNPSSSADETSVDFEKNADILEYDRNNCSKMLQYLISKITFETLSATDELGNTPLHLAIKMGFTKIEKLLFNHYINNIPEIIKRIEHLKEDELRCSISFDFVPKERAVMSGGYLYDPTSLETWLGINETDPGTRAKLTQKNLKELNKLNPKFEALYYELESFEKYLAKRSISTS